MNHRKQIAAIIILLGAAVLILDGKHAIQAGIEGVELCIRTVIPSLFPFLFLSSLLTSILWGSEFSFLRPLSRQIGIPKGGQSLLIAGFLGGYPAGAQAITEAYRLGKLEKSTAENLLSFCNNAGPAFLFGMTAMQFSSLKQIWMLWAIHILSALLTAWLLAKPASSASTLVKRELSLSGSLNGTIRIMASVCGWILLFRITLSFLERWFLWLLPDEIQIIISGFLELSIGSIQLSSIPSEDMRFILCSGMLAFGGLCVAMQTASVTQGLSLRYYFQGKLMQTFFSIALSLLIIAHSSGWMLICAGILFFPLLSKKRSGNQELSVV